LLFVVGSLSVPYVPVTSAFPLPFRVGTAASYGDQYDVVLALAKRGVRSFMQS
jgi:hypothetical protein